MEKLTLKRANELLKFYVPVCTINAFEDMHEKLDRWDRVTYLSKALWFHVVNPSAHSNKIHVYTWCDYFYPQDKQLEYSLPICMKIDLISGRIERALPSTRWYRHGLTEFTPRVVYVDDTVMLLASKAKLQLDIFDFMAEHYVNTLTHSKGGHLGRLQSASSYNLIYTHPRSGALLYKPIEDIANTLVTPTIIVTKSFLESNNIDIDTYRIIINPEKAILIFHPDGCEPSYFKPAKDAATLVKLGPVTSSRKYAIEKFRYVKTVEQLIANFTKRVNFDVRLNTPEGPTNSYYALTMRFFYDAKKRYLEYINLNGDKVIQHHVYNVTVTYLDGRRVEL